jgi:hypothetical protein
VPNTKGRIAAVKIHDLHHLLTGYTANWKGEVEIGAWEIASGCGKFIPAWVLNFGSFTVGLFLFPRALLHAFLGGRRTKTNLYHDITYDEVLLNKTVGELREYVGINNRGPNVTKDYWLFALWGLLSVIDVTVFLLCIYFLVAWAIHKLPL